MTDPHKRRSLASAPHTDKARNQKQQHNSTLIREVIAIVVIGALLAVVMTDAVVGMADDLASGPVVPMSYSVAEVIDGR